MAHHPVMAAFDVGQVPNIACFNKSTVDMGVDFDALLAVLQKFVDQAFAPVWGTPAKIVKSDDFVPGAWAMAFVDDADVQGALGYHDLTPDGLPLAYIFVKTTLAAGDKVSVTASHELAEMLVDPAINLYAWNPDGTLYAYEMSDAVESETFDIDGIAMTDFVYPAYFEGFRKPNSDQFDYLKKISKPFEILKGGYSIIIQGGKQTQIFGSAAKKKLFAKEDRRRHRSEMRRKPMRRVKSTWLG